MKTVVTAFEEKHTARNRIFVCDRPVNIQNFIEVLHVEQHRRQHNWVIIMNIRQRDGETKKQDKL